MSTSLIQILGLLAAVAAVGVMGWVYRKGAFLGKQYGLGSLLARAAPKGDGRPYQRLFCMGLHAAVVGLLLASFYGCATHTFQQVDAAEKSSVIFAVDASNSMGEAETQAWIRRRIDRYYAAWNDQADMAGIAFGGMPQVLFPAGDAPAFDVTDDALQPEITNLQGALRLAAALQLPAADKKIVFFTDGRASVGDVRKEAYHLRERGIAVYPAVPPGFSTQPEAASARGRVAALRMPAVVHAGEAFQLALVLPPDRLARQHGQQGRVTVYADGRERQKATVVWDREKRLVEHVVQVDDPGVHYLRVVFENDAAEALVYDGFVTALAKPRILLLEGAASGLAEAMRQRHFEVEAHAGEAFDLGWTEVQGYDVIFLNDIPTDALAGDTPFNLADVVREQGKGLIYNLGPRSAEGNLKQSPLYDILPMEFEQDEDPDQFKISLCIAIDNSGSMSFRGLDKAAQSLIRSWENMNQIEELCLFTFHNRAGWQTPRQPAPYDTQDILNKLENLQAGGGGINVKPALRTAYTAMQNAAYNRHVLLITDLEDSPNIADSPEMARLAHESEKITTHVLAIGDRGQYYRRDLQRIAEGGQGTYKELSKADNRITQVTWKGMAPKPEPYKREPAQPEKNDESPLLNGIPDALPATNGFAAMTAKDDARAVLTISKEDKTYSALAHWIQGNGRVAMVNAGVEENGGWQQWTYVDKFWSQTMRWATSPDAQTPYLEQVHPADGFLELTFTRKPQHASAARPVTVEILDKGGETVELALAKASEDAYTGRYVPDASGRVWVRLLDQDGQEIQANDYYLPAARTPTAPRGEQVDYTADVALLEAVATITGGAMLTGDEADPTAIPLRPVEASAAPGTFSLFTLWPLFIVLAMGLYWLEVAVRNDLRLRDVRKSYPVFGKLMVEKAKKGVGMLTERTGVSNGEW